MIGYPLIPSYVQLGAKKTTEKEHTITLLDFNMHYFGAFEGEKLKDPDKFFDVVSKINPDLMVFQEFYVCGTPVDKPMYKRLFKEFRKYHANRIQLDHQKKVNGQHQVFFSRFPIIDSGIVEHHPQSDNFTVFIDIVAHGDTIRVVITHLQSIKFDAKDYEAVKNIELTEDSAGMAITSISQKLKRAFVMRANQAQVVRDFINESHNKVLVMGDFNDAPASYAYRTVRGNLKDAIIESGKGLGRTYVGTMPSFRIDYILHDPSLHLTITMQSRSNSATTKC